MTKGLFWEPFGNTDSAFPEKKYYLSLETTFKDKES
jgi:hypothetical protein